LLYFFDQHYQQKLKIKKTTLKYYENKLKKDKFAIPMQQKR